MGSNCVGCTGHKARLETILFTNLPILNSNFSKLSLSILIFLFNHSHCTFTAVSSLSLLYFYGLKKYILCQKTHILHVNWREVEFAAIYTSNVLTIDTREIAREHARASNGRERGRGLHSFVRAFELTGANYFYARSREITPPRPARLHVTARAA